MKFMYAFLATICILAVAELPAQPNNLRIFDSRDSVERLLKRNNVPALGLGIIKNGELKEIRMYGEIKKGVPAPYNSVFNVASLTKPVVAILTMKLVNSGAWKLDEPLANYWIDPDIASDQRHRKLTTRIVLTHQTGFKNWRYSNPGGKLMFDVDPGTKYGYSGEGFVYLQRALEKKFGQPLEKLADSILFKPLGMTDTRLSWDDAAYANRFAHWYDKDGVEHTQDYKKMSVNAADDLMTTIEDYGRFAAHVLAGAGLDSSVYKQMVKPQAPTANGRFMCLGWEMFLNVGARKESVLTHSGSDAGVKTLVVLLPNSKEGLVIFMNGDNGYKLYEQILSELLAVGAELMKKQ